MNKRNFCRLATLAGLALALLLTACSGDGPAVPVTKSGALAAPVLLGLGAKTTSGAPSGIYLTWTRVSDPRCTGYYVYRDIQSIPDPWPEPLPVGLRTNGGNIVPQPPDGETVTFNDVFPCVIGQEYFYRVTAVNDDDPPQEGPPSNEMSWIIHGHTVTTLSPDVVYWGDSVTISGDTFGNYDPLGDMVLFTAVGGGTVEGPIESWTPTAITATVPVNTGDGPAYVVIEGTPAPTDNELTVLNPLIFSMTPNTGFVGDDVQLSGRDFGEIQGTSQVFLGALDISGDVTSWDDTLIHLDVPAAAFKGPIKVVVDGHDSNSWLFTPRPEILSADPPAAQSGEPLTLTGRKFTANEGTVLLDNATPLAVTSWSDTEIAVDLAGADGAHTITVVLTDDTPGNDFAYDISPALYINISGLDPGAVYRTASPPDVLIDTPADVERLELWLDGALASTYTALPIASAPLPVYAMLNGSHDVQFKAFRRALSAESAVVTVTCYSLVGDVNGDGVVDDTDRDELAARIGLESGDGEYRLWFDTDEDGAVTEADLSQVGYHFGDSNPAL